MVTPYKSVNKGTSQRLRTNLTEAERVLWFRLNRDQLGVRFYRQKLLGPFIVDFYCPHARLVVEVDGGQHYEVPGAANDEKRDAYLKDNGYEVLRFSNLEVHSQLDSVLEVITARIEATAPVLSDKSPFVPLSQRGETIPVSQKGETNSHSNKGRNTICVPITARTIEGAVTDILKAQDLQADMVELRLDMLDGPGFEALPQLLLAAELPVIVTVRSAAEGGHWQGSEEERFGLLEQAVSEYVEYIDVELRSDRAMRDALLANKGETTVIISWHDCEGTPNLEVLWSVFQDEMAAGADIGKIATMARSEKDVKIIHELLGRVQKTGKPCIALCMGELGIASRVNAAAWGSCLTFAALESGKGSAPGQLSINDMKLFEMKSRIFNPAT